MDADGGQDDSEHEADRADCSTNYDRCFRSLGGCVVPVGAASARAWMRVGIGAGTWARAGTGVGKPTSRVAGIRIRIRIRIRVRSRVCVGVDAGVRDRRIGLRAGGRAEAGASTGVETRAGADTERRNDITGIGTRAWQGSRS